MEKIQNIILILLIAILLGLFCIFVLPNLIKHENKISVNSSSKASIYLDGIYKGNTSAVLETGKRQIQLKVIPEDRALLAFEQDIQIENNTTTKVEIFFSTESNLSSHNITYFERLGGNDIELSMVSLPNLAQFKLDSQVRGFTPVKVNTTLGKHNLEVSFDGYVQRQFEIETKEGYRAISIVKLAKNPNYIAPEIVSMTETEEVSTPEEKIIQIEILDTPTGFLRVREEANSSSVELAQVNPGEKYDLVDKDTNPDWFKIKYNEKTEGWVSSKYVKIIEI